MPIKYRCPHCRRALSISRRKAGQTVNCPSCDRKHDVPALRETADTAEKMVLERPPVREPKAERPPARESKPERVAVAAAVAAPVRPSRPQRPAPPRDLDEEGHEDDDGTFALSPPERPADDVDLIPMVDCIFLLLVFYMMTATFGIEKMLGTPRPQVSQGPGSATEVLPIVDESPRTSITLRIDERNTMYVESKSVATTDELPDELRSAVRRSNATELIIEVHPQAMHEFVVGAIDAANEAEFESIRLGTISDDSP